jgi:hypothetical protein
MPISDTNELAVDEIAQQKPHIVELGIPADAGGTASARAEPGVIRIELALPTVVLSEPLVQNENHVGDVTLM